MADRLARIYGTEEDKVNCPFYHKIGACRHGDRCGRVHNKPLFSQTVELAHMYQNPLAQLVTTGGRLTPAQEQHIKKEFEDFYIDVFDEVSKFGCVEELHVCDNLADHLVGNVYIKYSDEEDAAKALAALNGRWYNGQVLAAQFCPVTDFHNARCKQAGDTGGCNRGGYCNYMHLKPPPRELIEDLVMHQATPPRVFSLGVYGDSGRGSGGGGYQRRDGGGGGGGYGGGRGGYGGGYGGGRDNRRGDDRYDRRGDDRSYDRRDDRGGGGGGYGGREEYDRRR